MVRETAVTGRAGKLTRAAAEGLFRLMAYKDEYEVARLHAATDYASGVAFHMSPPLITRIDPRDRPAEQGRASWMAGVAVVPWYAAARQSCAQHSVRSVRVIRPNARRNAP